MKDRVQYDMECHWLLCHSLKGEEVAVVGQSKGMAGWNCGNLCHGNLSRPSELLVNSNTVLLLRELWHLQKSWLEVTSCSSPLHQSRSCA